MSFGKRMQTRREELGLSQLALAKRLGVSQSTIGNYEAGISFPKEEILLRLFDCLETDPNALFRDSFLDLLGRVLLVLLMSVPGFCMAYFLIWLLAQKLHILPTSGAESLASFVMPCLAVSIGSACVVIRLLRSSLLGEMSKNYILTAQAKGLRRSQIILRHGLRNALTPSVSYVANTFGGLLGGSMITESVFSVPGIGSYALAAINNRDYIAIQGYVLITGFAFVLACLLADLLCAWLNPRIRLEG